MSAEWIHAVNALGDIDGRQHIVDPTLPRYGTDLIPRRVREVDRRTRRYRVTVLTS